MINKAKEIGLEICSKPALASNYNFVFSLLENALKSIAPRVLDTAGGVSEVDGKSVKMFFKLLVAVASTSLQPIS